MSWNLYQFQKDLSDFNSLLREYEVPGDYAALSNLEGGSNAFIDISFRITDVEFWINESISGTIPTGISNYKISFDLTFIIDSSKDKTIHDPFQSDNGYALQILVKGIKFDKGTGREEEYMNCWHLDRHLDGTGITKVSHPYYHFQNAGHKIEILNSGDILLTDAPRIPHPPMDLFLAFHFIVSNFFNRNTNGFVVPLLTDDRYCQIIERAQERMWKPYYKAYNCKTHRDYTTESLTPLYTVHS